MGKISNKKDERQDLLSKKWWDEKSDDPNKLEFICWILCIVLHSFLFRSILFRKPSGKISISFQVPPRIKTSNKTFPQTIYWTTAALKGVTEKRLKNETAEKYWLLKVKPFLFLYIICNVRHDFWKYFSFNQTNRDRKQTVSFHFVHKCVDIQYRMFRLSAEEHDGGNKRHLIIYRSIDIWHS